MLHIIRKIISVILNHAIPSPPPAPAGIGLAYQYYKEDQIIDSYNHFKKYFSDAVFLRSGKRMRKYAVGEAILNHQPDYYYLEFGVYQGNSLNDLSSMLKDITIHGFDSFEGLKEDMKGGFPNNPKGTFNLDRQPPQLNDNCVPVIGWIQDTLPNFISENKGLKINFVHLRAY